MVDSIRPIINHTLIIVDDHTMVREGTAKLVSNIEGLTLVAEADNGLTAISLVKKHKPTLLILDAAMPLARGIEVYSECRRWSPTTKIILQTGFTSSTLLADWLDAGVDGILLKSCASEEVEMAIRQVLDGRPFIAQAAKDKLGAATSGVSMTDREREVLSLIAQGNTNSAIGERLSISGKTVEKHRASLMAKLKVNSVAELMVYALREGFLDDFKQL